MLVLKIISLISSYSIGQLLQRDCSFFQHCQALYFFLLFPFVFSLFPSLVHGYTCCYFLCITFQLGYLLFNPYPLCDLNTTQKLLLSLVMLRSWSLCLCILPLVCDPQPFPSIQLHPVAAALVSPAEMKGMEQTSSHQSI